MGIYLSQNQRLMQDIFNKIFATFAMPPMYFVGIQILHSRVQLSPSQQVRLISSLRDEVCHNQSTNELVYLI